MIWYILGGALLGSIVTTLILEPWLIHSREEQELLREWRRVKGERVF